MSGGNKDYSNEKIGHWETPVALATSTTPNSSCTKYVGIVDFTKQHTGSSGFGLETYGTNRNPNFINIKCVGGGREDEIRQKKAKRSKMREKNEEHCSYISFVFYLSFVCNVWHCQCFGSAPSRVTHSAADRVNNYY